MNKKELPQRKNKGKNLFNSDWAFLPSINSKKQIKKQKLNQFNCVSSLNQQTKSKQIQRKQRYLKNKLQFKYTRGIHYFYDLHLLKRLSDSPSYVLFNIQKKSRKKSTFKISFSNQNYQIGNTLVSNIINRDYIGLPINKSNTSILNQNDNQKQEIENHKNQKKNEKNSLLPTIFEQQIAQQQMVQLNSNHKNICHKYLFSNEDRKHHIDLQIKQCQFIKKKFQYYMANFQKLRAFTFVQKDNDLYELLEDSLNQREKYQLLQDKIYSLKEKKIKSQKSFAQNDQIYYFSSLNQVLYSKIKQNSQKLLKSSIFKETLRIFNQTSHNLSCNGQKQKKRKFLNKFNTYKLIQKHYFDSLVLKYAVKLVSIRICLEGQHIFYRAKDLFLKIFEIDLLLQKQIKPKKQQNFSKKCKQFSKQVSNFYKKYFKEPSTTDSDCQNNKKKKEYVLLNQKIMQLSMEDYYFVKIFTSIYYSLNSIAEYLKKSEQRSLQLIDLFGSLLFYKFQNLFVDAIQSQQFGILPHSLDTLSEFLSHNKEHFPQVKWSIISQYNKPSNEMSIFMKQNNLDHVSQEDQTSSNKKKESNKKRCLPQQYLSNQQIKSLQIMTKKCNR